MRVGVGGRREREGEGGEGWVEGDEKEEKEMRERALSYACQQVGHANDGDDICPTAARQRLSEERVCWLQDWKRL